MSTANLMRGALCASFAVALINLPSHARVSPVTKKADQREVELREEVHQIPVGGAGATENIVVSSFRPKGAGPFPWIVISHGTALTAEQNRGIGRNRNVPLAREWVKRGYAVLVPIRRGYGASGGEKFGDAYGSCRRPNFQAAGEGAALDLLATIQWAKAQPDLDAKRWLLAGQSAGGFASIYTASKQPSGLAAVLAFSSGRGGRPDTHPGEPCASDHLAGLFATIAPKLKVPVLWFYAENDEYINPRVHQLWFQAFKKAGGRGELIVVPSFPERRGHGVFPAPSGVPIWTRAVAGFFKSQHIQLPF
jgi:dienelactone hydrolase